MVPKLEAIDASEPLEKMFAAMERDGGLIVKNFLTPELLKECLETIESYMASHGLYDSDATHEEMGKEFFPEGSKRVYSLLAKMPGQLSKILLHPVWRGIMDRFLSDHWEAWIGDKLIPQRNGYMLATSSALRLVPGAQAQPLHRDQFAYQNRYNPERPLYTPILGCLIAGSKTTYRNGATAVIPGSHLWDGKRQPKPEEATYAEMEPGDAFFMLGSTYHGAGANICEPGEPDAYRTIFGVFGQKDYYRHGQDELFATPIEIAKKLPFEVQKIVGYEKSLGGLGYVNDHHHPYEYLVEGNGLGAMAAPPLKASS